MKEKIIEIIDEYICKEEEDIFPASNQIKYESDYLYYHFGKVKAAHEIKDFIKEIVE